ncbi:MAG: hypothetical protein GMKNLPBB_00020 [Myxococcota bacterium]|nr:hypothetical protein [Myxococcota bacterium]
MKHGFLHLLLSSVLVLSTSSAHAAGEKEDSKEDKPKSETSSFSDSSLSLKKEKQPEAAAGGGGSPVNFSAILILGNNFGFNQDNPLYSLSFTPQIFMRIPSLKIQSFVTTNVSLELTNNDQTTKYRELWLSDTLFRVDWNAWKIPGVDINMVLNNGFSFPTSKPSRFQNRLFAWTPGLTLNRQLYGFFVAYTFSFSKNVNTTTTATNNPDENEENALLPADRALTGPVAARRLEPELLNTGFGNVNYSFNNGFVFSYTVLDELQISSVFRVINGFTYRVAEGVPLGRRDFFVFNFDVTYQPWDLLAFSVGWSTFVPQLQPDAQSYYNPFWVSHYDNFTTGYFNLNFML